MGRRIGVLLSISLVLFGCATDQAMKREDGQRGRQAATFEKDEALATRC